ncbi:MAG: hypothetical protein M0P38_08900 [Bacteroidales bacterium]|jgi:hypothetical protein|nr:hypothetical protein [Bacteroidales bacterium]
MIPNVLDNSATSLLVDLQKDFDISFEPKDIDFCGVFQKSGKATIYYNPKIVNSASIAHELLHVWLTRFNYSIGDHIYQGLRSDKKLNMVFNKSLCDYITNCCDHFKMYPKFINLGYKPADFLKNSMDEKASIKDLKEIKRLKQKFCCSYNSKAINFYIGSLFSIFADHVKNDYTQHHEYLKQLDYELYSIVSDFWNKWVIFDIENIDASNSDLDLTNSFIDNMKKWVKRKRIV